MDTLKATTIYFVQWFIISASLFPELKEQIHSSPDHHSLAAAPCSSFSSSLYFLLPLLLLSSSITVSSPPPHFTVRPASSVALRSNLWSTCCVWCFCAKCRNVLFLLLWPWHQPQSAHMFILHLSPRHFSWAHSDDEMNSCWHFLICFISRLIRATKPSENTVILAVVPQK